MGKLIPNEASVEDMLLTFNGLLRLYRLQDERDLYLAEEDIEAIRKLILRGGQ